MKGREPKKVLILAEHFAPAYKAGGIVRCLENLIMHLGTRFTFFILTSNNNLDKKELLEGVTYDSWVRFTAESNIFYASSKKRNLRTIRDAIQFIHPDVVYINGIYSVFFTLMPLVISKTTKQKLRVVLAPWGMLHNGSLSIKPLKKKIYLRLFKWTRLPSNIKWHATNEQEKRDIIKQFGEKTSITIADALPDFSPRLFQRIDKEKSVFRLITVSLITPNKGHFRVLKALKELQEEIQLEYYIYGPVKNVRFWDSCLEEIKTIKPVIKVIFQGFIHPSNLIAALQNCHVFILHSDGENFCQAIYEALSAGRPVITSDKTPWNGLQEANAGWNVGLNDLEGLKRTIKEAYLLKQIPYDELCKGAQEKAENFVSEFNFEKKYDLLFS